MGAGLSRQQSSVTPLPSFRSSHSYSTSSSRRFSQATTSFRPKRSNSLENLSVASTNAEEEQRTSRRVSWAPALSIQMSGIVFGTSLKQRQWLRSLFSLVEQDSRDLSVRFYVTIQAAVPQFRDYFQSHDEGNHLSALAVDARVQSHTYKMLLKHSSLLGIMEDEDVFKSGIRKLVDIHLSKNIMEDIFEAHDRTLALFLQKQYPGAIDDKNMDTLKAYFTIVRNMMFSFSNEDTDGDSREPKPLEIKTSLPGLEENQTDWHRHLQRLHEETIVQNRELEQQGIQNRVDERQDKACKNMLFSCITRTKNN